MALYDVGRLAVKIAGRDAGKKAVIVDVLDSKFVLIDGEVRRRKCNINHLELLPQTIAIAKGASGDALASALKEVGIELRQTKPKKAAERPRKVRRSFLKGKEEKPKKNVKKKAAPAKAQPASEQPTIKVRDALESKLEETVQAESPAPKDETPKAKEQPKAKAPAKKPAVKKAPVKTAE